MSCPRCGLADVVAPICPRCGVVFAKLRERPHPAVVPRQPTTPLASPVSSPSVGRPLLLLALLAATAAVSWQLQRRAESKESRKAPARATIPALSPPASLPGAPSFTPAPRASVDLAAATSIPEADFAAASDLARRLNLHAPVGGADVAVAEQLRARHPQEPRLSDLLVSTLMASAEQDRAARSFQPAAASLRRAVAVDPGGLPPRLHLMGLLLESADWTGAEAAAREALSVAHQSGEALEGLAYALYRQDRNREAAEILHRALEVQPTEAARALLVRIEKGLADERGMTEQHLSHFNVRYDGDAHEDVGREILRELERHYATLAVSFDHQPTATVPVVLFTRQGYYDASGAPAWSGGAFDGVDGRIRIPVGGLTSSLSPEMDGTLIHELTHAFINDMTRGTAPREIHEGLAQFMEGKRTSSMLSPAQLTLLADGRMAGVAGFYFGALSFAEYLVALRGQGGVNDLLRAMGTTGNVDEAFRQVYGQDGQITRKAWRDRLRLQSGS